MKDWEIVAAIRNAMAVKAASGTAGVVSVTIDGISTTYSWDEAKRQLQFWERRANLASGKKKLFNVVNVS